MVDLYAGRVITATQELEMAPYQLMVLSRVAWGRGPPDGHWASPHPVGQATLLASPRPVARRCQWRFPYESDGDPHRRGREPLAPNHRKNDQARG